MDRSRLSRANRPSAADSGAYSCRVWTVIRRRRYLIAAALAVAVVLLVVVGGGAAWRLGHRLLGPPPHPRQTDVSAIAGWMSVPYVGRAYRVPADELYRALSIEESGRHRQSLDAIAQATGRGSDEVLGIVRQTVTDWQATHSRPKPNGAGSPDRPLNGDPKPDRARKPDGSESPNGRPGGAPRP